MVISTAGWDKTSIAWEVRQIAEQEADWYFSSRGQCASWIRPEWLAQQARTLPAHVYARLHENRWVDGVGAWLSLQVVDPIFGEIPDGDGESALGVDIGIAHDRTVVARVQRVGSLVVVRSFETYTPTRWRRVSLADVEADVLALATQYHCPVVFDPFEFIGAAERLKKHHGVNMVEYRFTGDKRRTLFGNLLDLVITGRLRAQPHEEFRRELLGLEAKESASGWRVDHRAGGFDDHVVAVGLALTGLPQAVVGSPDLIKVGGLRDVEKQRLLELSRGAEIVQSWDQRSAEFWDSIERRPGGSRRSGLIL